ncbi:hypothetical protein BJ912DRAFT_978612 [Pholiota molesta]|nr:hypothetical protein BJ912DRAFT_978612 [Pholiota molesta]
MPSTAPSRRFIILDDSTVREARDRQEEKRPNKRARVDDSDDENASKTSCENYTPREDASANCVVRIQADMLSCCPTMNQKPFLCPHPVPTVDEYRAFYGPCMLRIFMESCSSASLSLLIDIAKMNEKKYAKVLDATIKKWCDRVWNKSTPQHELHGLLGVAYYVHVQDMLDRQTSFTEKGATQLRADPKLNNGQVMRLLTGYWSLVNLWERLRLAPIALPMGKSCSKENHPKIMGCNSADILALLACLRDQLSNDDDLKVALDPECRLAGLEALKSLRTKTQEGLADHFFACV